jgi:integrase
MPRSRIPGYLCHKARNKAKVIIDGKTVYLDGAYDSEESRAHYDRLIAELLTKPTNRPDLVNVTIARLAISYVDHAKGYYQKDGKPTPENGQIKAALKPLIALFRNVPVGSFGPLRLKQVREKMLNAGWVRNTVNDHVSRINRMLQWGVENELVPPNVLAACRAVRNLQKDRCEAPEGDGVLPVAQHDVDAVLPLLGRQVAAMVRLQLASGMRPQEVRLMRMVDVDRTDPTCWVYIPHRHKTQHHGKQRTIFLGPKSQDVLVDFLKADPEAYLFCPLQAYEEACERRRLARKTPMTPSQAARSPVSDPQRKPRHGTFYTKDSYNRAIARACEAAEIEAWSPNQLRHTAATRIRKEGSLEDSRVVLGHSDARTSQVYAERDLESAKEIMRRLG